MEIGNLPEKGFRVTIVKMIQELGKRMDVQSEIYINAEETPGKLYTKILTVIISAEW